MAQPYDNTTLSTLAAVSDMFVEQTNDYLLEPAKAMGGWTAKAFNPKGHAISGDGETFKLEHQVSSAAVATRDMLAEFPSGDNNAIAEYRIRFNQSDPTLNDFGRNSSAVQVSLYDMDNKGKGAIIDLVERLVMQFKSNMKQTKNLLRNTGQSGIICYINGTKKANDGTDMGACSAYSSGATSFRANVDNGTVARMWQGMRVDVYNSSGTLLADRLKVTHINAYDFSGPSVGFEIQSGATIANCDGVADNAYVVLYDSYNKGSITIDDWMNGPANTSDSFLGGVNRTQSKYHLLVPYRMRLGQSAATVNKSHLDDLIIARQYHCDEDISMVRANPEIIQTLRNQIEAAALIPFPADTAARKRYAQMGTTGLSYQSPKGIVAFEPDPLMTADKFDVYAPEDWFECTYGPTGLRMMPGDSGLGYWSRMPSATPGAGKTVIFRMEALQLWVDRCRRPWAQARVLNLQP